MGQTLEPASFWQVLGQERFWQVALVFCGVLVVPLVLDLSGVCDPFVKRLGDQAYEKYLYHQELRAFREEVGAEAYAGMSREALHAAIQARLDEKDPANFERISKFSELSLTAGNRYQIQESRGWKFLSSCWSRAFPPDEPYSADFFRNVIGKGRFYYGCKVFEKDFIVIPLLNYVVHIPVGFREDIFLYICNNHTFLSTFLATRGNPRSRSARRLIFFVQMAVFYFMLVLSNSLGTFVLLSIIVIVGFTLIDNYFLIATTCYCLYGLETSNNTYVRNFGRLCKSLSFLPTAAGIAFGAFLLQDATARISEGTPAWPFLRQYFMTVFVAQLSNDLIPISYIFAFGNAATMVYIPLLRLLCREPKVYLFGNWFHEMIDANQFVEDVHYKVIEKDLFLLFFEVTKSFAEKRPRLVCPMRPLTFRCKITINSSDVEMIRQAQAEALDFMKRLRVLSEEVAYRALQEVSSMADRLRHVEGGLARDDSGRDDSLGEVTRISAAGAVSPMHSAH